MGIVAKSFPPATAKTVWDAPSDGIKANATLK